MSTNRSRRINRDTAEQLLAGARAGAVPGDDALAGLLAAVCAPMGDGELPGEQAAVAAFRSARLAQVSTAASIPASPTASTPVATPRKRNMLTPAMLLSAKVAATVVATALGGVAVAAGTGHLPAALGGRPASSAPAPSASASASRPGELPPGVLADSPEAVPAALAELCRAYAADSAPSTRGPAEVLAERRFAPLVAAAGGPADVPGYCAPVLGGQDAPPGSPPTAQPTSGPRGASGSASASPKPSGKPEPGKRPEDPEATRTPAGPGSRPTGRPTGLPSTGPTPPQPRDDTPTTRPIP
ncbi:hypothetical protein ACIPUC_18370 [Streptomyces sp. LARHCF249]